MPSPFYDEQCHYHFIVTWNASLKFFRFHKTSEYICDVVNSRGNESLQEVDDLRRWFIAMEMQASFESLSSRGILKGTQYNEIIIFSECYNLVTLVGSRLIDSFHQHCSIAQSTFVVMKFQTYRKVYRLLCILIYVEKDAT